jgi:acyl carrier protein
VTREQLVNLVSQSFVSTASEAGVEHPNPVAESTALVGPDSVLDSMALVTLLLDLEQRFEEETGVTISLMSEQALSRRHSPFRSIGSLVDYILEVSGTDGEAG